MTACARLRRGAATGKTRCRRRSCWTRWTAAAGARRRSRVGEEVVDQERGDEERPQQRLLALPARAASRVGGRRTICCRRRPAPCGARRRRRTRCAHPRGLHHQCVPSGSSRSSARPTATPSARDSVTSQSPRPECSPRRRRGRKEIPVLHGLAEGGVGDVVRGQREVLDGQPRFALGQRPGGGGVGDRAECPHRCRSARAMKRRWPVAWGESGGVLMGGLRRGCERTGPEHGASPPPSALTPATRGARAQGWAAGPGSGCRPGSGPGQRQIRAGSRRAGAR